MRSIETSSVPNERKIEKQEEQEERDLKSKQLAKVGVETILKREDRFEMVTSQQKYRSVRKRRSDDVWFGVPLGPIR